VTGSNQPLDIPTTVTTGATSAAAVTIKATAETQNIMPGKKNIMHSYIEEKTVLIVNYNPVSML
jgi:hypothetical protein